MGGSYATMCEYGFAKDRPERRLDEHLMRRPDSQREASAARHRRRRGRGS
jgi:hypothetical protein